MWHWSEQTQYINRLGVIFSHLVGNIPYEATEEKLKEIFSEVGPVLSLKWVKIMKIQSDQNTKLLKFLSIG